MMNDNFARLGAAALVAGTRLGNLSRDMTQRSPRRESHPSDGQSRGLDYLRSVRKQLWEVWDL